MRGRAQDPDPPLACSMTASTYRRVPPRVTVSKKSQASRCSIIAGVKRRWATHLAGSS